MGKIVKIAIIVILVAAAGFFVYRQFSQKPDNTDLAAMQEQIIGDPKINEQNAPGLTEEVKAKFLEQFPKTKQALIASNFDSLQLVNEIAQIKRTLGDFDGAIVAWEYANIIRPQNSLSFSNLAALYHFDIKDYAKAESNYLVSISNDPDDISTIRNFFELYHYSLKDDAKAEALLASAIKANPEAADLYSLAGKFYTEIENLPKAVEYYEKHLTLNPDNQAVRQEVERLKKLITQN